MPDKFFSSVVFAGFEERMSHTQTELHVHNTQHTHVNAFASAYNWLTLLQKYLFSSVLTYVSIFFENFSNI